jgi:DnaJ-class molecular chaperone
VAEASKGTGRGSLRQLLARTACCPACGGKGWVGSARGNQFAQIGRMAAAGTLPKRPCEPCNGTGLAPKVGRNAIRV